MKIIGVNIINTTTIAYLRFLIIEIGSTIILILVEAQGKEGSGCLGIFKVLDESARIWSNVTDRVGGESAQFNQLWCTYGWVIQPQTLNVWYISLHLP